MAEGIRIATLGRFVPLPPVAWREVASALAAFVTAAAAGGGMLHYFGMPQAALLAGLVAGMLSGTIVSAGIVGGGAHLLATLAMPLTFYDRLAGLTPERRMQAALGWTLLAVACGAGVRALAAARLVGLRALAGVAVALVLANLWASAFAIGSRPVGFAGMPGMPSPFEQLDGNVPRSGAASDQNVYIRTVIAMREGTGFYRAFVDSYRAVYPDDPAFPASVWNVRMPLGFTVFSALGDARGVTAALLVLVSALVVFATLFAWRFVHPAAAVPSAAVLAAYALAAPLQIDLMSVDVWAGVLVAGALLCEAWSRTSGEWLVPVACAAALGAAAALTREIAALAIAAGLAASLLAPGGQRRVRLAAWGIAAVVFATAFALHWRAVTPLLVFFPGSRLVPGGLAHLARAFRYGSFFLGMGGWLPVLAAVLGFAGIAALPGRGSRTMAVLALGLPMLAFLFIDNRAANEVLAGARVNYWGALVLPSLYALGPFAFAFLPGARVRGPSGTAEAPGPADHLLTAG